MAKFRPAFVLGVRIWLIWFDCRPILPTLKINFNFPNLLSLHQGSVPSLRFFRFHFKKTRADVVGDITIRHTLT